ncbi:MAG: hypothetical protein GX565_10725 [Lentisphaerae bacterium]|jgi:hypothetical protein|nr:hypothetical protein [Lentisphaerota bacterium]
MKIQPYHLLGLALLLAGCGEGGSPVGARNVYPALNESPPPPMPRIAESPGDPPAATSAAPRNVVMEDSWMQRHSQKEEMSKSMRDYAARAGPDDPFALSEERIKALEAQDDCVIY